MTRVVQTVPLSKDLVHLSTTFFATIGRRASQRTQSTLPSMQSYYSADRRDPKTFRRWTIDKAMMENRTTRNLGRNTTLRITKVRKRQTHQPKVCNVNRTYQRSRTSTCQKRQFREQARHWVFHWLCYRWLRLPVRSSTIRITKRHNVFFKHSAHSKPQYELRKRKNHLLDYKKSLLTA